MKNWLSMLDYEPTELEELVRKARELKRGEIRAEALRGRILTMVFFNPSLRTRTSFEAGMLRHGGHAICLSVGGDTWQLEHQDGVVMDGACSEHVREAAPVLSRYGDLLAVRTFAGMQNAREDARDRILGSFGRFATVPVINMESALEHPCQGLADWMTMDEKLEGTRDRRFVLSWAPHIKGLPMAVSHSAVLSAAAAGMQVTITHPPGYELNSGILDGARSWCAAAGTQLRVTNDQRGACAQADVVYVKSWGSTELYGEPEAQRHDFERHREWSVGSRHLGAGAILMHCLPVRRNLVILDEVLDDPRSVVVDQAENRQWTQVSIMNQLLRSHYPGSEPTG